MQNCRLVLFSPEKVNTLNEPEAETMLGHISHISFQRMWWNFKPITETQKLNLWSYQKSRNWRYHTFFLCTKQLHISNCLKQ